MSWPEGGKAVSLGQGREVSLSSDVNLRGFTWNVYEVLGEVAKMMG